MTTSIEAAAIEPILDYFSKQGLSISTTLQLTVARLKALTSFKRLLETTKATNNESSIHSILFRDFHQIVNKFDNKA
jgi:hypothetical protein